MDPQLQQEIHEHPPQSQTLKLTKISTLLVFVARGSCVGCQHYKNTQNVCTSKINLVPQQKFFHFRAQLGLQTLLN